MRVEAKGKHAMSLHHVVEEWQGPAGAEWMHTVGFGNLEGPHDGGPESEAAG